MERLRHGESARVRPESVQITVSFHVEKLRPRSRKCLTQGHSKFVREPGMAGIPTSQPTPPPTSLLVEARGGERAGLGPPGHPSRGMCFSAGVCKRSPFGTPGATQVTSPRLHLILPGSSLFYRRELRPREGADLPRVPQLGSESPLTHFSCLMAFYSAGQLLTSQRTLAGLMPTPDVRSRNAGRSACVVHSSIPSAHCMAGSQ